MTKRISELPAAGSVADNDELELNQSGVSRKATRGQVIAGLASVVHQHGLADVTDSGGLAALDSVGTGEIEPAAYASASEAQTGTENTKIMTALRTAQAIAAQAPASHPHLVAEITDAGALAALDKVGTGQIETAAYASQSEAVAGSENSKVMTALRTAQAVAALSPQHQHVLADVTDAGPLAYLDIVGAGEIAPNSVTSGKILAGAVTEAKLANLAVSTAKIATAAVTSAKIETAAVTSPKIATAAVTEGKLADGAVGASKLQPGIPIDMQDAVLDSPELRDYAETSPTAVISGGSLILDLEAGNVFDVTLTQNVTNLSVVNPPSSGRAGSCTLILKQDGTGGRTLTWPSTVKWAGGTPPAITSAAGAVDIYALVTRDGGVTWYGFPGGQDFS